MEHGRGDELQHPVAQVQGIAGSHGTAGQIQVGDILQVLLARLGGDDLQLGADSHQLGHTARVVGLVMVHNQVIHILHRNDLADVVQIFVKIVGMYRLDQDVLLSRQQVGIVGGTIFGFHYDVKDPQGRVEDAHRPEIFTQLDGAHGGSFLSYCQKLFPSRSQYIILSSACQALWDKLSRLFSTILPP